MFKIIKDNKKGTSLIELLVSVTLFSVIVLAATRISGMVIEGQRNAIAAQELQSNLRYVFEVMSKEIRTARGAHDGINCGVVPYYKTYNTNISGTDDNSIYFKNKDGECVAYELWVDNRIYVKRGTTSPYVPITPSSVEVLSLLFHIEEDRVGEFHSQQGIVSVDMEVKIIGKKMHEQKMKMQTSIASRYYE
jgi:prepilin-type N-terminal cleavage/methylation domain-containing protein